MYIHAFILIGSSAQVLGKGQEGGVDTLGREIRYVCIYIHICICIY
jgi:hypothetical protein